MGDLARPRIKVRGDIPLPLQAHLVNKRNFMVHSRIWGRPEISTPGFIIYEKRPRFVVGNPPATNDFTTINDRVMLGRMCKGVKDNFHDPAANKELISFRIMEKCRSMTVVQKQWCQDWIERNVNAL